MIIPSPLCYCMIICCPASCSLKLESVLDLAQPSPLTEYKKDLWHNHFNAFHAAGECRRPVKNVTKCVKNVNIVEFHYHIWNHHEKCIQQSTNMPGIC